MKTSNRSYWQIAFWILWAAWVVGTALGMAKFNAGFFTSYLVDLTFPAWFYILVRGLHRTTGQMPRLILVGTWFGESPARAAIGIFTVGFISEIANGYWKAIPMTGTYDPLDIAAYAIGILCCYLPDKYGSYHDTGNTNSLG